MKILQPLVLVLFFLFSLCFPAVGAETADPLVEEITFNKISQGLEEIVFKLNGAHIPKIFAIKGKNPRVVFDFLNTRAARSVKNSIVTQGNLVEKVRVGLHTDPQLKTRVVLDLVPEGDYDFKQDFSLQDNTLTISVFLAGSQPEEVASAESPGTAAPEQKEEPVTGEQKMTAPEEAKTEPPPVVENAKVQKETQAPPTVVEPSPAAVVQAEEKKEAVAADEPQMPASDPVLRNVSFENSSNKGEMVIFKLNDFHPPVVFGVEEGQPRVVCDFMSARLEPGVREVISAGGKYVETIRVAKHSAPDKIRVVLDLVPNKNYDLQQVFFKEDNLFVIIVNSYSNISGQTPGDSH